MGCGRLFPWNRSFLLDEKLLSLQTTCFGTFCPEVAAWPCQARLVSLCRLLPGNSKIHHFSRDFQGGIAIVRGGHLLGLLFTLELFKSSRSRELWGGGFRFIRRNHFFSWDKICHNWLDLVGSKLLRRGGLGGRFPLGADVLFAV